ncbi:hypothetical protein B0O99DRAFT_199898 [Bisporella sp. PMI_857]|nr:hypothetical protein B0O99DRAFT_199898 [Bisporella sp. PMI_857]
MRLLIFSCFCGGVSGLTVNMRYTTSVFFSRQHHLHRFEADMETRDTIFNICYFHFFWGWRFVEDIFKEHICNSRDFIVLLFAVDCLVWHLTMYLIGMSGIPRGTIAKVVGPYENIYSRSKFRP